MPQPRQVTELADALAQLYAGVWQRLTDEQTALLADWFTLNRSERLARLRELTALVEVLTDTVDEQALRWVVEDLPSAFLLGAMQVTGELAGDDLAGVDLNALAVVASDTYGNLLEATSGVRQSTKVLVRRLAREHVADKLVRGQTAVAAGRDLAQALAGEGLTAVTYADGSRHGLREYAGMVLRTQTATAYSRGNLAGVVAAGVDWVEVFDNPKCGLRSHDDPDKPNGTVRSVALMQKYPISHPNCVRAIGARPDITSAAQARRARGSASPAQNVDQAQVEQTRELAVARRAAAKAVGVRVDRRTLQLLAEPGTRVTSPAHARVLAARQVRTDRAARLAARRRRLAQRAASRETTDG